MQLTASPLIAWSVSFRLRRFAHALRTKIEKPAATAVGFDGRIGLCVDEQNRSWCSSSKDNDQRAVTIECASDTFAPYKMTDEVFNSLVELCVDICKRNDKNRLIWIADKEKALNYQLKDGEMLLTVHRWFAKKECPGEWLYARLGELAYKVNKQL